MIKGHDKFIKDFEFNVLRKLLINGRIRVEGYTTNARREK